MKNRKKYYLVRQEFVTNSAGYTNCPQSEILHDSYIVEILQKLLKEEVKDEIRYTNIIYKGEEGWAIPLVELSDYAVVIKMNRWFNEIKTRTVVYSITERWV